MRAFPLHTPKPLQGVGADGYQEFTAGVIPVKQAVTIAGYEPLVVVEHQRGFQLAFDRHLDALRDGAAPFKDVDYLATWLGMTGGPAGPPLIRLELAIDGLRPRVRLLFKHTSLPPLWFLAERAQLGLLLARTRKPVHALLTPAWLLGPTPVPRDLRRILRSVGVPQPPRLAKHSRRERRRRRDGRRGAAAA